MLDTGLIAAQVAFLVLLYLFVWRIVRSSSRAIEPAAPTPSRGQRREAAVVVAPPIVRPHRPEAAPPAARRPESPPREESPAPAEAHPILGAGAVATDEPDPSATGPWPVVDAGAVEPPPAAPRGAGPDEPEAPAADAAPPEPAPNGGVADDDGPDAADDEEPPAGDPADADREPPPAEEATEDAAEPAEAPPALAAADGEGSDSRAAARRARSDSGVMDLANLHPKLVVESSPALAAGTEVDLEGGLTIGRSGSSDVTVEDPFVSHMHARILRRGAYYFVEDLGSTNGTFLNDQEVGRDARLKVRDSLTIGQTVLRYEE